MTRRQGAHCWNHGKPRETRHRHPRYPASQKELDCPLPASRPQAWGSPAKGLGYKTPRPQEQGRIEGPPESLTPRACTGEVSSPCIQWQVLVRSRGPSPSYHLTGHPKSCPGGSERGKAIASPAVRVDMAGEWGPGSDPQTPNSPPYLQTGLAPRGLRGSDPQTCTLRPRDTRQHAPSGGHTWTPGPDAQGKQEMDPGPGPGQGLPTASQMCCPSNCRREAQWPFLDDSDQLVKTPGDFMAKPSSTSVVK